MGEFDRNREERSPDRSLPEDEDSKEDAIEGRDPQEISTWDVLIPSPDHLPEEPFYKDRLYNLPREFLLSEEVYKWYHYYYYYKDEREEKREGLNKRPLYNLNKHRLYKNILNAFTGDCTPAIYGYLRKWGAVTVKELVEEFGFKQQTVSLALKSMKIVGLATVRRKIKTRGKPADVWALIPAELEHINRAENKYNELLLKEREEEIREHKHTIEEIKKEIKYYLDSKGTKEAALRELYPRFKTKFTDYSNFRTACFELSREGYRIWL